MSNLASGLLGAVAATLALGAVHLEVASGNDLLGPVQRGDATLSAPAAARQAVNRTAKGDRGAVTPASESVTLSFRIPGTADQSVAMRVSSGAAVEALRKAPAGGSPTQGAAKRQAIACEPVVSVLTAVAKQLEPGRCVT